MKKSSLLCVIILMVVGIFAGSVQSAIIIEPDDYPNETELGEVYPGVNLSVTTSDNQIVSIWSVTADIDDMGHAPTGLKVFGHSHVYFWNTDRCMRVDFSQGASSISLIAGGSKHFDYSCQGILEVYDSGFQLLDTYQTEPLLEYDTETMVITRPQNDIYYAIAYTMGENPFGRLDRMELVVPEPATFSLLALGVIFARRTRK